MVRQFQFHQKSPGQATLRVIPDGDFDDAERQRMLEDLGRKFDGRVDLTIEVTDSIPLTPRGKAVYVEQSITPWEWDGFVR